VSTPTEHPDPRPARSRARTLAAAVAILREEGLPGLTIEAVAARSGVAKSTIYRQFADREALHFAAVHSVGCQVPVPSTADLVDDLVVFCTALDEMLRTGDFGALLPTALDGAERSEPLSDMVHGVGVQRRRLLGDRLQAAQAASQLAADVDLDMLTSQLVGPLFYRRFISRQAAGHAFVARHVAMVLTPLVSRTTPPAASPAGGG
jgi:AcrR family transcriptional regulator